MTCKKNFELTDKEKTNTSNSKGFLIYNRFKRLHISTHITTTQDGEKVSRAREIRSSWNHLVCPAWRKLKSDLITVYNFLKEGRGEGGADLLSLMISNMDTSKWTESATGEVWISGKRFCTQWLASHQTREMVMAPSQSELWEHLENALSRMV